MHNQVDVVRKAWKAGLVIPSFNIPYFPMMEPVVQAVADQESFAQISTAQIEWQTLESKGPGEFVQEFQKWCQPKYVKLHLDHIPSIDEVTHERLDYYRTIKEAINLGYPSVMVDGSHEKTLDENIKVTRRVVDLAHAKGVSVEGEVGQLFGYAAEDMPSYEEVFSKRMGFTTEEDVRRMVQESGCDWLSVAAGSFHGAMVGGCRSQKKGQARLDVELIQRLSAIAKVPLVIHGGSGILKDDMRAAVKQGIAKVNVAQYLRLPYQNIMKEQNNVTAAQQVVYDLTASIIKEYFNISGSSKVISA